ncbi:MAG: nitroreductase family protein [archaeon]|nr:MAG: nitroreductase family protein [archaeon]
MQLDKSIRSRRSIRKYLDKKVSFSDITEICDAARFAPMACNKFSVRLIVVSNKEKIKKIAEISQQPFIADGKYIIVVCTDKKDLVKSFGDNGTRNARQQAGAAIEHMLLKITDLGLSACWVGWFDDNALKRLLKIPKNIDVEALFPIGYAAEKPKKLFKTDLKSILFFDEWDKKERK